MVRPQSVLSLARRALVGAVMALTLASCAEEPEPAGPMVLAAASMQEALNDAADTWADDGHLRPVLSFAGSGALARQIGIGAPADIYITADERWLLWLGQQDALRDGSQSVLTGNDLVLIAPSESEAVFPGKGEWQAALDGGRLALADPDAAPAGMYARAALTSTGVWSEVGKKLALAPDVRGALALVARGAAPLGIVYRSDGMAEAEVRIVGSFPASSHKPIEYHAAILARSRNPDAADFHAFLLSEKGQDILRRHGFGQIQPDE